MIIRHHYRQIALMTLAHQVLQQTILQVSVPFLVPHLHETLPNFFVILESPRLINLSQVDVLAKGVV